MRFNKALQAAHLNEMQLLSMLSFSPVFGKNVLSKKCTFYEKCPSQNQLSDRSAVIKPLQKHLVNETSEKIKARKTRRHKKQ